MPVELTYTSDVAPVIVLGRPRYRFGRGELHVHGCPECYEDGVCMWDCEWAPDLSEEGEPLRGSHTPCDPCRLFPHPQEPPHV